MIDVDDRGTGNRVVGAPSIAVRSKITFWGNDALVEFGASVRLFDAKFAVYSGARVKIGSESICRGQFQVGDGSRIELGERTICNWQVLLRADEEAGISLGNDCLLSDVTIYASDLHTIFDLKSGKRLNSAKDVTIGRNVWLSRRVMVLKGSTIGAGSVIGAGAIVTGDIPPMSLAAGNPARVIRSGIGWQRSRLDRDLLRSELEQYLESLKDPPQP